MAREKHSSGERQRSVRRLTLIACPAGVSAKEHRTGLGWRQGRNVGKQSCPFEHFGIRVRFTRRPYRPATGKILQRRKTKSKVSRPLRRLTSTSLSFSASFRAIRPIEGLTFRVRRRSHNSDVGTTTGRRDSEEPSGLCLLHQKGRSLRRKASAQMFANGSDERRAAFRKACP